jgi:RNA polymerase subunit RPABC4/transcription elongation factor Spt4
MIRKAFFRMSFFILAFGLVFVLVSCKKPDDETKDQIAPLIEVNPERVELFAGKKASEYDPMTGIVGRDDVDGTITNKVEVDKGDFNPNVPGEYTFTYTLEDAAGNKTTAYRTVVVIEVSAALQIGDAYTTNFVVNPQLLPQYVGAPFGFDLTKVHIFSKDYIEWALANYPERLASFWGALVIVDAEGMVVHSRYLWVNTGYDEEGVQVTFTNDTLTWVNYPDHASSDPKLYQYRPITQGGLFGDILRFIPDGGTVLLGVNGFYNGAGSPKKFFEDHIVNTADNGLGKIIDITTIDTDFDPIDTWPIIKVPYQELDTDKATARTETRITLSPGDPYDLLDGITAKSAAGNDITHLITYKVYEASTMNYTKVSVPGVEGEIEDGGVYFTGEDLGDIDTSEMNYGDPTRSYWVEYTVVDPDNGKVDTSYRLYEVVAPVEPSKPSQIIFGETTEEIIYNDTTALLDQYGSGINMRLDTYNPDGKIFVYSRRGFLAAINDDAVVAAQAANKGLPILPYSVVVVVDKDGKVVQYRNWTAVYDAEGNDITADYPKVVANANGDRQGQLADLEDVIPLDGYVVIFPVSASNQIRLKGLQIFWNPEITASNDLASPRTVDWTQPVVTIKPNTTEIVSAIYGREEKQIHFNSVSSLKSNGTNVNMRFASDGIFFVYTKEGYIAALTDEGVIETSAYNQGMPYLPYGIVVILNADGTIAHFRVDGVGQYDTEGNFKSTTDAGFDDQMLPGGSGGLLAGIDTLVPDGGYVVIFPFTGANDQKAIALEMFWNEAGDINQPKEFDWTKPILKIQELGHYVKPFDLPYIEEEFEDTPYNAIIGEKQYHVSVNDADMWAEDTTGYSWIGRTQAFSHIWHIVTHDQLSLTAGKNVNWLGLVIVCNPDGTIHHIRIAGKDKDNVGLNNTIYIEEGELVVAGADHAFWGNGSIPDSYNAIARIEDVTPEGGFVIVIPGHFGPHLPIYEALMAMPVEELAAHSFLKPVEPVVPTVTIGETEFDYSVNDETMWAEDTNFSWVGRSSVGDGQLHVVTYDQLSLTDGKNCNWGGLVVICNPDGTIYQIRTTASVLYKHELIFFEDGVRQTATSDHALWGNGEFAYDTNYNAFFKLTDNIPEGGFIVVATQHSQNLHLSVYDALVALSDAELINVFQQISFE